MRNTIMNGLKQDLTFKGALHLSLKDQKVNGCDKLVINVNTADHGTWVDMIVIYNMLENSWENFRIGGNVDKSLTGHQDLMKWIDICINELDWSGVISGSNKDSLIVEIFNFVNGISGTIITPETVFKLKDQDGLWVETFYPWPDEDPEDSGEDEEEDEVIEEEIVEEVVEEEEYTGYQKPVSPEEVIQFLDYKLKRVEDGGLGCKSPNFIFSYENEEVYSKLDLFIEKDEEGNPRITKADLYQKGFGGSRSKTKSISTPEDLEDFSNRKEEFESRIMNAASFGSVTSEAFYTDRLRKDISTLIMKLLEGMEWKESLDSNNQATATIDEDDEY